MKRNVIDQTATILYVCTILVSILLLQEALAFEQEWTATQKEIWRMQKKAWELWEKGEMDGYKELFHKDCIIWFSRFGSHESKDIAFYSWPSWIESFELQPSVVKVFGDVAIIKYICSYETPGWDSKARFTNIWKKQNGKWTIIVQMANDCEKPVPCLLP
ncbi:MAG: nuclear transport factor 2 family protein [Desulfobacterales bacterium]